MADHTRQQLGNYRLVNLLGSGGFAEVYLGEHLHLGTQAAIKLLHTRLATTSELEQFRTEARIIATLQHPNIVRLLDFGVEESTPYLVLDYAPNGSLRSRFPVGTPLPPTAILPVLHQIASALHYAHEHQVVHRDVKPENLLLGRQHEVLLSDFGIATVAQNTSQQRTQGVAGTAAYMAPEQLQGKPRPASDLYALGVVVYEWLCGERPFQGGPIEVATQHLVTPPPPLREKVPTIPAAIEQVVLTALAKDPKDRFGNMRAFVNAFGQACGGAGSIYLLSTQALLPLPSTTAPSLPQTSQGGSAGVRTPAGGQASQTGASIYYATTHLSPQLTPPVSAGAPAVASTLPPLPATSEVAQQTPSVAAPSLLATTKAASRSNRSAAASDEPTLAEAPPTPGAPVPGASRGQRKGGARRWALAIAACLVILALLGGGAAYALTHFSLQPTSHGPTDATSATVTITPQHSDLTETFPIAAVTGTPDPSQRQVGARTITAPTQSYSAVVQATGQGKTPGTHASGQVGVGFFLSFTGPAFTITAGSSFPNQSFCGPDVHLVIDQTVTATAGQYTTVAAHVAEVGPVGNFPGGNCPVGSTQGTFDYVDSANHEIRDWSAFSGGTDPQTYTAVAQSDIDNAANNLISANQPNAQQVVQGQLQQGEQLIGTPQCSPHIRANHEAGYQTSSVTVTVSFTCTGEAYDQAGALMLAQTLLTTEAQSKLGTAYALVGQIKTNQVNATLDDQGNVTITVNAEGVWAFQFSNAQKQALAQLIAGKSRQEAMNLLAAQTGVAQGDIQLAGGNGQTLPTDSQKITVVIQPVPGA
jgi:VCBS repeat-containing protein